MGELMNISSPFFCDFPMASLLRTFPVGSSILALAGLILAYAPKPERLPDVSAVELHSNFESSIALRDLNAGYGPAMGAEVWVGSIFSYAGVLFDGDSSQTLSQLLAWTCDLDTSWSYPRLIAAWAIPQIRRYSTKDALPFLEDGAMRFPKEWQFRLTWAQYVLEARDIDSSVARDSAARILLPLSSLDTSVPQYVRGLAFTLLHKNGRPEEAMSLLLQTYEQVPDPMVRLQFRDKIGDLLGRNAVPLGSDSVDFMGGVGALLESKDQVSHQVAHQVLTDLVNPERRESGLLKAKKLAEEYRSYRTAQGH